jgi:hypothetical protein
VPWSIELATDKLCALLSAERGDKSALLFLLLVALLLLLLMIASLLLLLLLLDGC